MKFDFINYDIFERICICMYLFYICVWLGFLLFMYDIFLNNGL